MLPAGGDVYATEAEVAVYVLARVAGEGADRQAGPRRLCARAEEHAQLADLCRLYRHVVLLINAGGVVDLSCLDEFPAIEAVLVISQPGMEGGRAVADVLSGAVNPSGKLTDTWPFRYADYPNAATFSHNNGNVEQEIYQEGLYVGYRYFDSFEIAVRYGFGFGLSYTEFELDGAQVACAADGTVLVKVAVTNAGKRAGREVVQLYAGLPDGKLEKEPAGSIAFAKTGPAGSRRNRGPDPFRSGLNAWKATTKWRPPGFWNPVFTGCISAIRWPKAGLSPRWICPPPRS